MPQSLKDENGLRDRAEIFHARHRHSLVCTNCGKVNSINRSSAAKRRLFQCGNRLVCRRQWTCASFLRTFQPPVQQPVTNPLTSHTLSEVAPSPPNEQSSHAISNPQATDADV